MQFGVSLRFLLTVKVAFVALVAPELISGGPVGFNCDTWNIGVITYVM